MRLHENRLILGRLMHDASQYIDYGNKRLWGGTPKAHALSMIKFWALSGFYCEAPLSALKNIITLIKKG